MRLSAESRGDLVAAGSHGAGEQVSAFVSWNLDLAEIWRTPFTDLHVLVDEWDQDWGRGNQELAATVRQLCTDHLRRWTTTTRQSRS